ncbi:MAG: hypothetical protein WBC94_22265, partial [Xanthobacteraceae bacterium]
SCAIFGIRRIIIQRADKTMQTGILSFAGVLAVAFCTAFALPRAVQMSKEGRYLAEYVWYIAGLVPIALVLLGWAQSGDQFVTVQRILLAIVGAAVGGCALVAVGELIRPVASQAVNRAQAQPAPSMGDNNTIYGNGRPPTNMGSGNTIVGPTDEHNNTIIRPPPGGLAVGAGAKAGPGSVSIGAGAGSTMGDVTGNQGTVTQGQKGDNTLSK